MLYYNNNIYNIFYLGNHNYSENVECKYDACLDWAHVYNINTYKQIKSKIFCLFSRYYISFLSG